MSDDLYQGQHRSSSAEFKLITNASLTPDLGVRPDDMKLLLTELNSLIHDQLEIHYVAFLESLTQLDEEATRKTFCDFSQTLDHHRLFEDTSILPLLIPGTDIDAAELARISGDHTIIERTLARVTNIVDAIFTAKNPRRTLVQQLSGLVRMQGLLEHHTERETQFFYPILDQTLSQNQKNSLAQSLREAIDQTPSGSE
mgnify:CR=1 FL=1